MGSRELGAVEYYSQVSAPEACRLFGVSRATWWRWVREGRVPKPRYVADHEPRWRLGELVELLEKQAKYDDAPRGLKGSPELDKFVLGEKDENSKAQSVWERLGLKAPK